MMEMFLIIIVLVVGVGAWLVYCICALPHEDEYGRKQQSKAFMKRQKKVKNK